jgi:hypothetical protein
MSGWRREGCRITTSPDLNRLFPASANPSQTMANKINERGQSRAWHSYSAGWTRATSTPFWQPLHTKAWAGRLQTSYLHTRNSICPWMLATSFCGDSAAPNSADNRIRPRVCACDCWNSLPGRAALPSLFSYPLRNSTTRR